MDTRGLDDDRQHNRGLWHLGCETANLSYKNLKKIINHLVKLVSVQKKIIIKNIHPILSIVGQVYTVMSVNVNFFNNSHNQ